MIELLLLILAFLLLLMGLIGSIVPMLPGPPLSFAGLLLLQWSGYGGFPSGFLWLWAAITVTVTMADHFLPVLMTRQFGGSRSATIGSLLGVLVGIFVFPPIGMIVGPFLGALVGELIHNRTDSARALKVALGAFLAFFLGSGAKLIVSSVMLFYAIKAMLGLL